MPMTLTIDGKDYRFEYTIEASLYEDCAETIMLFVKDAYDGQENMDFAKTIASMSNLPKTALTVFYAGLLEHHGPDGDRSVCSLSDAKVLVKKYMHEHANDDDGNFYSLMVKLMDQMREDGFFRQIGLDQMNQAGQAVQTAAPVKTRGGRK